MPKSLYHYTSLSALEGILQQSISEEMQPIPILNFWASHFTYLNDPKECKKGIRLAKELLPDCETVTDKHLAFIISLSRNPRHLHMWNMYAEQGKGVVLKLDKGITSKEIITEYGYSYTYCYYGNRGKRELVEHLKTSGLESLQTTANTDQLLTTQNQKLGSRQNAALGIPFSLKEEAYKEEQEVRLLLTPDTLEVKFRQKDHMMIPYIEKKLPGTLLQEIIIGPAVPKHDRERLKNALLMMLYSRNFFDVKVSFSNLPYR